MGRMAAQGKGLTGLALALCSSVERSPLRPDPYAVPVPDSSILRMLNLLEVSPELTQREMAREMGVSLGKAN